MNRHEYVFTDDIEALAREAIRTEDNATYVLAFNALRGEPGAWEECERIILKIQYVDSDSIFIKPLEG